jgi:5-methylthioadenosine/S-adenosylhomocysteine deaminase
MEQIDTLISARWVVPVEPDGRVLEDHAVATANGRIAAVLPRDEAMRRYPSAELIDRPTHVLLPGFVNAHTHAAMVLLRGRAENRLLGPWLRDAVWPLEKRWVDPEYVRDGTELAIAEMLRAGITCFADQHLFPEIVATTCAELHMRASVGLVVTDAPTLWAASADEYMDKGMRLRDEYKGDPLVCVQLAPHAPYSVSDATLERVRRLADELEVSVAMHLHETRWEVEQSIARFGMRPIERAAKLGLLSPLLIAVHMTEASEADIDQLAEASASVVHCPRSNLKLGSGVAPVPRMLGKGVRVAIGTDGAASNNSLDVLAEARVAGLLASGVSATPGTVTASDLLRLATLEGAKVLGLGEMTGSLVAGKWADMCCMDLNVPGCAPVHDVPSTIVYAASSSRVTDVWVAGRRLLANGSLSYMDETELLARALAWEQRMSQADAEQGTEPHD